MRTLDVARELDAPAGAVWAALVDIRQWPRWGPSVRGAELDGADRNGAGTDAAGNGDSGHLIGPGSTGRVRTAVGVRLPFEVTDFEPGRRWAWKVAGVAATGHRVEPVGPDRCRAVIEVPAWAPAYAPLCWVALGRLGRISRPG